jgi:cell division septation protein DedD
MAKARRPAKKSSSKSSRPKAAKKTVKAVKAKKAKATKKAAKPVKKIELKKLREQFAVVLAALSARRSDSPDVEAKLDDSRRRISQWMTDVDDICSPELQEICGPDMAFPMP